MRTEYFKVIHPRKVEGVTRYFSAGELLYPTKFKVEYKKGCWTKPPVPNGKLFVFIDDVQMAEAWMKYMTKKLPINKLQIWRCEVKAPERRPDEILSVWEIFKKYYKNKKFDIESVAILFNDFYNSKERVKPKLLCTSSMLNSIVCSSIKLVEKV